MDKFWYTVVGYYPDNNQPYVEWVEAETPGAAVKSLKPEADLEVVDVFKGKNKGIMCNDKTITVAAIDPKEG